MKKSENNAKAIELIVGLKMPDATAITTLNALNRIGFSKIKNVSREDYYKFYISGDIEKFKSKISNVDILVNANKNNFKWGIEKTQNTYNEAVVSVSNVDDSSAGLISTLSSLGFKNIEKIEKRVLWTLAIDAKTDKEALNIGEKAAKELLANVHYQEYEVFKAQIIF